MVNKFGLVILGIVLTVQVSSAYHLAVPISRQPYGEDDTTYIIGGETATQGQFPYQAAISVDSHEFWGGSLISKSWVLTAAQCINGFKQWTIVLGAQNIKDTNEPGRVTMTSHSAIVHENYNPYYHYNDIGLIYLPQEVTLTGTNSLNPTLQFVDLNIISPVTCRDIYGDIVRNTVYCASGADKKSPCRGDNGDPLTIGTGKNITQLGIDSFVTMLGCSRGYPVGFTAVPFYVDWISNKTGIPVQGF